MLFGASCSIIEQADNTWWHVDDDTSSQAEVANDKEMKPKSNRFGLKAIEPDETDTHIAHSTAKTTK